MRYKRVSLTMLKKSEGPIYLCEQRSQNDRRAVSTQSIAQKAFSDRPAGMRSLTIELFIMNDRHYEPLRDF